MLHESYTVKLYSNLTPSPYAPQGAKKKKTNPTPVFITISANIKKKQVGLEQS